MSAQPYRDVCCSGHVHSRQKPPVRERLSLLANPFVEGDWDGRDRTRPGISGSCPTLPPDGGRFSVRVPAPDNSGPPGHRAPTGRRAHSAPIPQPWPARRGPDAGGHGRPDQRRRPIRPGPAIFRKATGSHLPTGTTTAISTFSLSWAVAIPATKDLTRSFRTPGTATTG